MPSGLLQALRQPQSQRRLAAAADGNVADHHDWNRQLFATQPATSIGYAPQGCKQEENSGWQQHQACQHTAFFPGILQNVARLHAIGLRPCERNQRPNATRLLASGVLGGEGNVRQAGLLSRLHDVDYALMGRLGIGTDNDNRFGRASPGSRSAFQRNAQ